MTDDATALRAHEIFAQCAERMEARCRAMEAEHNARGLLGSGATIKVSVRIFEDEGKAGLQQVQAEVSKRIESRGRSWDRAMGAIEGELESYIALSPTLLSKSFRLSKGAASAIDAGHALAAKSAGALRAQQRAFREGWTAPISKKWPERHPVAYAVGLLVVGALISVGITAAFT